MTTTAILLAGGSGTRLGTGDNKAYLPLGDHPLLVWSLVAFERCALIDDVVLVTRDEDRARARVVADAAGVTKLRTIVEGGATRHASEHAGLSAIADGITAGRVTLVAIHDAARPFVSQDLLARLLTTAAERGGSVPALGVGSSFLVRAATEDVVWTADLRRMQTPQAFHAGGVLAAYRAATAAGFHGVDTAETVEHHGELDVAVVAGDPDNRKVTFADDLRAAEERAATWPEAPHRR
jgi:2-C-methyl-D-erythritol 4-phosphate cytidylyltransferase